MSKEKNVEWKTVVCLINVPQYLSERAYPEPRPDPKLWKIAWTFEHDLVCEM